MPSYAESLGEDERWALAYFVLSLSAFTDPLTGERLRLTAGARAAFGAPGIGGLSSGIRSGRATAAPPAASATATGSGSRGMGPAGRVAVLKLAVLVARGWPGCAGQAVEALVRLGPVAWDAFPGLAAMLNDTDPRVAIRAATVLGRIATTGESVFHHSS